jgi:predicted CXXCH cytochrome family protein
MILYTRVGGAGGFTTQGPAVECGSCHDPHEAAATTTEVSFMRIENNNSNVCLSCHVK